GRGRPCGSRSSRRASWSPVSHEPLLLLPRGDELDEPPSVVPHLGRGRTLVEDRPGRAGHDALAAGGAAGRLAPGLSEVCDDPRIRTAAGHVPGVRPLDLV